MKKFRKLFNPRLALAGFVALAALAGAFLPGERSAGAATTTPTPASGITPVSQLPTEETQKLQIAVKDKYYGLALASQLDGVWGVKIAYGGVFASSNQTMIVTAYRPLSNTWTAPSGTATPGKTPIPQLNAAALFPSVAMQVYVSDTSISPAGACLNPTATALTTLTIGSNGGFVPLVTGKAGMLILNSNGTATLKITKTPTLKSYAGCVVMPNGRIAVGGTTGSF